MSNILSRGEVRANYDEPVDPTNVHVLWELPVRARVTSVTVRYVQIPLEVALAKREEEVKAAKRHAAAVKANATRKAKKEAKQP